MYEIWTRAELRSQGMTPRAIDADLDAGSLIRVRKGHYVRGDSPPSMVRACRVGGRLGCVSLLAELGVFVFDASVLHVHMERGDSRMRSDVGADPLPPRMSRSRVRLHWRRLIEPLASDTGVVRVVDALAHAFLCQEPRYALATFDSVLNKQLLAPWQVDDVFASLPGRFQVLRRFADSRAQAGTETLVRLMVLRLGHDVDLQVEIAGVGHVDLIVDGWLAIECDSKEFHSDWRQQLKDYRRDRELATLGYCVLRLTAEDILYHPELVMAALRGILTGRRH